MENNIILQSHPSKDGAIGFILNKILPISLDDVLEDFPEVGSPLSIGGPVAADTLHYLHTFAHIPDAIEIVNGIYWGGNMETVRQMLSISVMKPDEIRFFLGYSGWTGGQLDEELKNHSWLVADIRPSQIIHPSSDLWQHSVKNMGEEYQHWTSFPENPALN